MRRTVLPVALMLIVGACDSTEPANTTVADPSSTTSSTTTTPTTSTSTMSTTTTTMTPTTTTSLLAGNWAEVPLIAYDDWGGIALGWWDGSQWIQSDAETELPVSGGKDYQVALLGSDAILEGGAPIQEGCEVLWPDLLPGVPFSDGNALYAVVDDGEGGERFVSGVAISAPWTIYPRSAQPAETHPNLEEVAIAILGDSGYDTDSVEIVQTVDSDLDGDGSMETMVVAEETELANEMSDVYSVVFAVSPAWDEARVVDESVIPPDQSGFPASFRISAVADLSGDGQMEIVLSGIAWENSWVTVHELTEGGFVNRIGAGCGV